MDSQWTTKEGAACTYCVWENLTPAHLGHTCPHLPTKVVVGGWLAGHGNESWKQEEPVEAIQGQLGPPDSLTA